MSDQPENTAQNLPAIGGDDALAKFTTEAAAVDLAAGVGAQDEPLAAAAPNSNSDAPNAAQATLEEPLMSPSDEAAAIVSILTQGITALYPVLDYQNEAKEQAAQKLAPLIKKYGVGGSLLAKWEAEIEAGLFFGAMAFNSYMMVKADKAAAAQAAQNEAQGKTIEAEPDPVLKSKFAKWFKFGKK
jgi:hypothetical protein